MTQILMIIGIVVLAAGVGIGSRFVLKRPDNKIEEIAEEVIYMKTGIDVDLSPDTPDPDDEELEQSRLAKKRKAFDIEPELLDYIRDSDG